MPFDGVEHRSGMLLYPTAYHPEAVATGQVCMASLTSAYVQARRGRFLGATSFMPSTEQQWSGTDGIYERAVNLNTECTIGKVLAYLPADVTHVVISGRAALWSFKPGIMIVKGEINNFTSNTDNEEEVQFDGSDFDFDNAPQALRPGDVYGNKKDRDFTTEVPVDGLTLDQACKLSLTAQTYEDDGSTSLVTFALFKYLLFFGVTRG